MCTQPILIYNRSHKINYSGSAFTQVCRCGKCEECKEAIRDEWFVRAYIEHLSTINKGGFSYFETLTYNNSWIPRKRGLVGFDPTHIKLFLKRLRINLERAGYDVADNLKYLITSELGGKTHRPHFHCIFHCSIPNLDVMTLWRAIRKAWFYGFNNHKMAAPSCVINRPEGISYVVKYITKDQEFEESFEKKRAQLARVYGLVGEKIDPTSTIYKSKKAAFDERMKELYNAVKPFHRQSIGYGSDYTVVDSLDEIVKTGKITLPDSKRVKKAHNLPMYLVRKLFYTLEREVVDGETKNFWKINELGKRYKKAHLKDLITNYCNAVRTVVDNLQPLNVGDTFDYDTVCSLLNTYLGEHTLEDYATYCVVYKDRLWSKRSPLPSPEDFYSLSLEQGTVINESYSEDSVKASSFRSKINKYRITGYRFPQFKNFDALFYLLRAVTAYVQASTNNNKKRIQTTRDRLKLILEAA